VGTNANSDSKRRLELLEKAYLEDRERRRVNDERWRIQDARTRAILRVLLRHSEGLDRYEARHRNHDRRFERQEAVTRGLIARLDAQTKILRRLLEK